MKKKKRIFVGIPTIGTIVAESAHSMCELMIDLARMEQEGYEFMLAMVPRMLVAQARELIVEKALEWKADYIFMIDDDMVAPRNIVKRLISHKKDIVGALSWERLGDHNPNIYKMASFYKDKSGKKITGTMRWGNVLDWDKRMDKRGLVECDVVGFGCVLINTRIFKGKKGVQPTWFMSQFQVGEDFFFCWKAKENGWRIFMDCHREWHVAHMGLPIFLTERNWRFNQEREKLKQEAAANAK